MKASPPARFQDWLGQRPAQARRFHLASKALGAVIAAFRRDQQAAGVDVGETTVTLPSVVWGRGTAEDPGSGDPMLPGWKPEGEDGRHLLRTFEAASPQLAQAWASIVNGWAACFRWRATVACEVSAVRVSLDRAGAELTEREVLEAFTLSLLWIEFERESERLIEDYEAGVARLLAGSDVWPAGVH